MKLLHQTGIKEHDVDTTLKYMLVKYVD